MKNSWFRSDRREFGVPAKIVWWIGALLPTIVVLLDATQLVNFRGLHFFVPLNLLIASVLFCASASYYSRSRLADVLIDIAWVLLLALVQITVIALVNLKLMGLAETP